MLRCDRYNPLFGVSMYLLWKLFLRRCFQATGKNSFSTQ